MEAFTAACVRRILSILYRFHMGMSHSSDLLGSVERNDACIRLERLIVNDNKLREVTYKTSVEVSNTPFASLQSISLSKNCITEWSSVDALNAFPSLVELRLQNNPITDSAVISPALVRQFIIARIGQLNLMNGSQVRPKERADAEKAYIKLTLAEAVDKGQSVNSFLSDPNTTILFPRLKRLVEVHGVPDVPKASSNVGTLADSILSLSLATMSSEAQPIKRKLPGSMTVAKVKILMQQLFKLDASKQRLYYRESATTAFPLVLDDDFKSMSFYGIADGGTILMEEIDVNKMKEKREKELLENEKRMERQLQDVNMRMDAKKQAMAWTVPSGQYPLAPG